MNLVSKSLSNAWNNISRNKLINFLCFGIIAFTLLIFGIFNYLTFNLEIFIDNFSKNVEAIFYFKDDVEIEYIDALIERLNQNLLIESVSFTSKEQAELQFSRRFPDLNYILSEFKESPFPASIEIIFKQNQELDTKVASLINDIEKLSIVESKQVNLDWARKFLNIKQFISIVGLFLSGILIFVSIFIIFNVIKLNIFYRKDEINILSLVGATNWYIKFPFIIEGALLGFAGSLLAGFFLYLTIKIFPTYAGYIFNIVKDMIDFNRIPGFIFYRLILLGTSIGFFSSLFSIKQFVKPTAEI